jgi:GH15 family glucan-1,4-alpha-glucosidase
VFGEVMSALEFAVVEGGYDVRRIWPTVRALVDWVADHWSLPESGIWEVRGGLRHFVHGKLMCWVALDRGERLAERTGLERGRRDWAAQRDRLRAEILTKGWSDRLGAFKQSYEDERLDAANLMLPLVGFLPGDDPRVIATIDAILARLVNNGLCYRYLDAPDGIAGGEGTFVLCTFWLIQALLLAGRRTEARALFDALLARATALGLFAEELDPTTGEHLGNFPQAFSHIGLVHTAIQLAR